jgi:hypothetical protein
MGGQDFDWLSMIELTNSSFGSSRAQKIPRCTLIRLLNDREFWICKKCVNNVYAKYKGASNDIENKLDLCKSMEFSYKISIFLIFGFTLRT